MNDSKDSLFSFKKDIKKRWAHHHQQKDIKKRWAQGSEQVINKEINTLKYVGFFFWGGDNELASF